MKEKRSERSRKAVHVRIYDPEAVEAMDRVAEAAVIPRSQVIARILRLYEAPLVKHLTGRNAR